MKTSKLEGEALDWAIAKCESLCLGEDLFRLKPIMNTPAFLKTYKPSSKWSQGGPIIEREGIDLTLDPNRMWRATNYTSGHYIGSTPLIAAMRCYIASKLGEEVDIPKELLT